MLGLFISQTLFATGLKLLKATENHHSQYHGLAYSIQLLMKKKKFWKSSLGFDIGNTVDLSVSSKRTLSRIKLYK